MRTACSLLVAAALGASLAAAQLAQKDWPQFGRSPDFNSFSASGPKASPPHPEWNFTAQSRVVTSPAVHNGVVYAGSDSGNVLALNSTTGAKIWSVDTGSAVRSSPAVLEDGSIIIGSYNGNVYHISASGDVLATAKTDYSVYAPVSIAGGTAYVGSMDQHLYSIDIKSFKINWKFKGTAVMNSGAAVSEDGSKVYAMDYHGILYCIDAASGSQVWQAGTGSNGGGGSSPVLDNAGTVYVGSWSMSAFAFDAATGASKWSFDAKGEIESHGAFHDGVVYFSAEESRAVYALDAATGKQIWAWAGVASQELNGSPTLTPSLLYVGSNDHKMHCLDRASGEERFSVEAQANVFASAAVADDGWVYFADNSATLDEINEQHAQMIKAFEACGGDHECSMSRARAIWEAPTASEVRAGASAVGHVYAINPSLHLN